MLAHELVSLLPSGPNPLLLVRNCDESNESAMSDRGLMLLPDAESLRKRVTFGGSCETGWVRGVGLGGRSVSTQPCPTAAAGSGNLHFERTWRRNRRSQIIRSVTSIDVTFGQRCWADTHKTHQSSFWIVGPTNGPTSNTRTPRARPVGHDLTLRSPTTSSAGATLTRGGVGFLHRQTRPLRIARPTWLRCRRREPTAARPSLDR